MQEYFAVASIRRADVRGFVGKTQADRLTDEQMTLIAKKMGDVYVAYGSYWQDLEYFASEILK